MSEKTIVDKIYDAYKEAAKKINGLTVTSEVLFPQGSEEKQTIIIHLNRPKTENTICSKSIYIPLLRIVSQEGNINELIKAEAEENLKDFIW